MLSGLVIVVTSLDISLDELLVVADDELLSVVDDKLVLIEDALAPVEGVGS